MKYVVRLRKTIVRETLVEISDDMADRVVDAMDIAEGSLNEGPPVTAGYIENESKWAVVSVQEKNNE